MQLMPKLTVVYGGQFGSEGKGQVIAAIVRDEVCDGGHKAAFAVRVGGPNAGHTVRGANGEMVKVQSIPSPAFTNSRITPVIGAGGLVNIEVLKRELAWWETQRFAMASGQEDQTKALLIDNLAMVVQPKHAQQESDADLQGKIGSTKEGVGAALAEKIRRDGAEVFRDVYPALKAHGALMTPDGFRALPINTVDMLNQTFIPIYVEGTQGYLLSLSTSGYYPFCTSRECGPEGILADVGLTPRAFVDAQMVCVFRTFPIRVGGNSGDLPNEIDWDTLKGESEGYIDTPERTTVTNRIRRIGRWDIGMVCRVVRETRPTSLAISFLDYLFPEIAYVGNQDSLGHSALDWLGWVQRETGVPIHYVSTGPGQENTFKVRI